MIYFTIKTDMIDGEKSILQKFESGYTIPKKARLADVAVTIR